MSSILRGFPDIRLNMSPLLRIGVPHPREILDPRLGRTAFNGPTKLEKISPRNPLKLLKREIIASALYISVITAHTWVWEGYVFSTSVCPQGGGGGYPCSRFCYQMSAGPRGPGLVSGLVGVGGLVWCQVGCQVQGGLVWCQVQCQVQWPPGLGSGPRSSGGGIPLAPGLGGQGVPLVPGLGELTCQGPPSPSPTPPPKISAGVGVSAVHHLWSRERTFLL